MGLNFIRGLGRLGGTDVTWGGGRVVGRALRLYMVDYGLEGDGLAVLFNCLRFSQQPLLL